MKIIVTSTLNIPFEQVRRLILRPDTMHAISRPIMYFKPLSPAGFPEHWDHLRTYKVKLTLLGFIPLGWQVIKPEVRKDTKELFVMVDAGSGQLTKQWDHSITIQRDGSETRYRDEVDVQAMFPLLTPIIASFAWIYYHHRQRRWRNFD